MANLRVLVVDDDAAMREVLAEGLQRKGFDVVTTASVSEALACISTGAFDALLSDLHLSGPGDGLTLASAMRRAHPQAATIIQTGYPLLEKAANAILLEADDFLAKPTGIGLVVEAIHHRLANPHLGAQARKESAPAVLSITDGFSKAETARAPIQPPRPDQLSSIA
jgi:DNA-binding NtrC family response regulator